uniref:Uncharacterized protein n=1 Tax=Leersia perrieri TaxID=77586 RepID=A0A0D9W4U9_9ORYZ
METTAGTSCVHAAAALVFHVELAADTCVPAEAEYAAGNATAAAAAGGEPAARDEPVAASDEVAAESSDLAVAASSELAVTESGEVAESSELAVTASDEVVASGETAAAPVGILRGGFGGGGGGGRGACCAPSRYRTAVRPATARGGDHRDACRVAPSMAHRRRHRGTEHQPVIRSAETGERALSGEMWERRLGRVARGSNFHVLGMFKLAGTPNFNLTYVYLEYLDSF